MPISAIDSALRRGLGFAGKVIGTQFDVYRLGGISGTPNAAPSLIDDLNKVLSSFPVRFVHEEPKVVMEQAQIYDMLYLGMCDTRQLKVGDVFVEIGPTLTDTPDGRMFVLTDVQPLLPAVFARVEVAGSLTRPNGENTSADPILGVDAYQGEEKFTEAIVVLNDGMYEVALTGTPATIPVGIQPHKRFGSSQEFNYPTATHRGMYFGFCPLLPGIQIQPGDVLSASNGDRYVIHVPSVFTTGIQGYTLQMESLFT